MPLHVASLIGCGVTTGVGAAINAAQIKPGSSVCVVGCGGVGASRRSRVRASRALPRSWPWTRSPGSSRWPRSSVPPTLSRRTTSKGRSSRLTVGEGFDYVLECVGHPQTIRSAYDVTRRGGTVVVVGAGRMDQKIEFTAFELFYDEKTLKGSIYGSANVRVDFDRLLRLWKRGKLDLEGMISRRIKLEDVNDAFRAIREGEVIRSVIDFE